MLAAADEQLPVRAVAVLAKVWPPVSSVRPGKRVVALSGAVSFSALERMSSADVRGGRTTVERATGFVWWDGPEPTTAVATTAAVARPTSAAPPVNSRLRRLARASERSASAAQSGWS